MVFGGVFVVLLLGGFVRNILNTHSHPANLVIAILMLGLFLVLIIQYGFFYKAYFLYGISGDDLQERLFTALDENQIKYEEKLTKIKLPEINNELIISQAQSGSALIRLRNKKDSLVFNKIIKTFTRSFENNPVKVEKGMGILYAVFGIVLLIITIAAILSIFK
jgi:hypothetical protein